MFATMIAGVILFRVMFRQTREGGRYVSRSTLDLVLFDLNSFENNLYAFCVDFLSIREETLMDIFHACCGG